MNATFKPAVPSDECGRADPRRLFNPIAARSRSHLFNLELLRQVRAARGLHGGPVDPARLLQSFPMAAGLLGAGRVALQRGGVATSKRGFFYAGRRYRVQVRDAGAFAVLDWKTGEALLQSPPGAV